MKLKIINKNETIELDGIIKRNKNKFFIEIEVPDNIKLDSIISNIKGYYNSIGNITLINNKNISARGSKEQPNITIYEYEAGYAISSYIDENAILIKSMLIYFKELDYFFVKDKYDIDVEKMREQLTITQKYQSEELLNNERVLINYNKMARISHDDAGHILFLNPAKLSLVFHKSLKLPQILEEITKLENCFGFVIGRKMNLIEVNICDSTGIYHDLIVPFQKEYNDVLLNEFYVVDLNSKQLLKDILKQYYSNNCIAATINMFYEYIYNDLDNIFEFTSLVNTLELVLTDKKYNDNMKKYTLENNEELKENNKKMYEIFERITEEQCKFIKKFYKFENIELRDKLRYIFYNQFNLEQNCNSEEYISKIIKTRNYYVHGGNKDKTLDGVDMICTEFLLKNILYILIMEVCSDESNCMIDSYKLTIPTVYKNVVENLNLNKEKRGK